MHKCNSISLKVGRWGGEERGEDKMKTQKHNALEEKYWT